MYIRTRDKLVAGYILMVCLAVYWTLWFMTAIANSNEEERLIMFYNWIPRTLLGIPVEWITCLFSFLILLIGLWIKRERRIRWYRIPGSVLFMILVGLFMTFFELFKLIIGT